MADSRPNPDASETLSALERRLAREIGLLAYPSTPWTRDTSLGEGEILQNVGAQAVHVARPADDPELRDARDVDVLIIDAGQSGLTTAAKLRRECLERVLIVDCAPADSEGPWGTWARMRTLRAAKELRGPDAGFPAATFLSWFTSQHGEQARSELGFIPRGL